MLKFNFQFVKKYGYWHCIMPFDQANVRIVKLMLCDDIANMYLKDENKIEMFQTFVLQQNVDNYYDLFQNIERFSSENDIKFSLNQYTQDKSSVRKLTAKIFQYVLVRFARYVNPQSRVILSNGVQHDVMYNGFKIDAKTKNGFSKWFNKDYQLTTNYNTTDNNNDSDYYCFGVCAKNYWKEDNIIDFTIAGIIKREDFYQKARVRQVNQMLTNRKGQPTPDKNGQKMYAKKADYVIYAEMLDNIESFFKR